MVDLVSEMSQNEGVPIKVLLWYCIHIASVPFVLYSRPPFFVLENININCSGCSLELHELCCNHNTDSTKQVPMNNRIQYLHCTVLVHVVQCLLYTHFYKAC